MGRRKHSRSFRNAATGYTIVEVMVVLAVTGGLFVAIAGTLAGRQAKTEFGVAAREMESQLQDVVNDVSTGFYSNPGTFQCNTVPISGGQQVPNITSAPPGGTNQGTNDACIFIGRVNHFNLGTNGKSYNIYTVAGAREMTSGVTRREVQNFDETNPRPVTSPPFTPASNVDITEERSVPPGLVIDQMYYRDSSGRHNVTAVGFFTTFGSYGTVGINSGSTGVNVVPLSTGTAKGDVVTAITNLSTGTPVMNPSGGVFVCMNGDGTNSNALLSIGGSGQQLTTDLQIRSGKCVDYP